MRNYFEEFTNLILLSQNCAPRASKQQEGEKKSPRDSEYCEWKMSLDLCIYTL